MINWIFFFFAALKLLPLKKGGNYSITRATLLLWMGHKLLHELLTNFFSLKNRLALIKFVFESWKNYNFKATQSCSPDSFHPLTQPIDLSFSLIQLRGLRQNSNNVQSFCEMTIYATHFCHPSHDWLFHDFIIIPRCHNISCFVIETFIVMFGDSSRKAFGLTKKFNWCARGFFVFLQPQHATVIITN